MTSDLTWNLVDLSLSQFTDLLNFILILALIWVKLIVAWFSGVSINFDLNKDDFTLIILNLKVFTWLRRYFILTLFLPDADVIFFIFILIFSLIDLNATKFNFDFDLILIF